MGGTVHPDEFHYRRLQKHTTKNYPNAIPLRRLSSKSTSASLPSYNSNENPFETASIISNDDSRVSTVASLLSHASESAITAPRKFVPTTRLQVQTPGHGFWALPFVINNTETVIFTPDEQNRCQRPKWISIRREKGLGNFWVHDAEDETQTAVARAVFKFGPTTDPRVRIGIDIDVDGEGEEGEEFEIKTRWMSRTTSFGWKGRTYQWRYGDKKERQQVMEEMKEDVHDLLLLEEIDGGAKGKPKARVLARFVRGDESRTPGTKRSHAGNGGRLEMAIGNGDQSLVLLAPDSPQHEESPITELVVITTLLVMLKREVDRLRSGQIAGIANSKGFALIGYGIAYAAGCKVTD